MTFCRGVPHAEKLGWRLGCQTWSFHDTTFYDALDRTASLGLHYVEAFPGQQLRSGSPLRLNEELPAAARRELCKRLSDQGLTLVNFGVGGCSWAVFDLAKDLGIETVISEPPAEELDRLDELCVAYGLNLALHNPPRPARFWQPRSLLRACLGCSRRIGVCGDTGHWMRSGVRPLEAVGTLCGRILCLHLKDLNGYGRKAHEVPWGTGCGDIRALLTEVHCQRQRPFFPIEYERHVGWSLLEIVRCIEYFDAVAAELTKR